MAASIKSFGVLNEYVDSVDGDTAVVGEISDNSYTYSYDKDILRDPAKDGGSAVIFHSKLDDGSDYQIPAAFKAKILDIIESVSQFDNGSDAADQFNALYSGEAWTDVTVGQSILAGTRHIPTFIIFKFNDGVEDVEFKIWFSDSSFANDYDEFEIRIIPPFEDINGLYGSYADVSNALQVVNIADMFSRVLPTRDKHPTTIIKSVKVTWIDRADDTRRIPTDWVVLGYGPLSNQQTNIIAAIRDYMLANSSYTLEEWVEHFPEIVALDIFTFIPLWDKPAISVSGLSESIYNPTIAHNQVVPKAQAFLPTLSRTEIEELGDTTMILYKSIGFIVLGEYTNSEESRRFSDRFLDYSVLSINDSNINRLSEQTRTTIQMLERLCRECETDDGISTPPNDMARQTVGQLNLLTSTNGTVHIRMATKASYLAVIENI